MAKKQPFEGLNVTGVTDNTITIEPEESTKKESTPKKQGKSTFNTKIYECCATEKDTLRPLLQCVYFENGYAYAADGTVAIKQSLALQSVLDPEELDGKFLPRDSYKAIMGFEIAQCTEQGIECWNTNGQKVFFEYLEPGVNDTIPNFESYFKNTKSQTTLGFIGINPKNVQRVSNALYSPYDGNIRFQFTGIDSAIIVDVIDVEEQTARILPAILSPTLF